MLYNPVWYLRFRRNGTALAHLRFEDAKRGVCGCIVPQEYHKPEPFDDVCYKCRRNYMEGLNTCWKPLLVYPAK